MPTARLVPLAFLALILIASVGVAVSTLTERPQPRAEDVATAPKPDDAARPRSPVRPPPPRVATSRRRVGDAPDTAEAEDAVEPPPPPPQRLGDIIVAAGEARFLPSGVVHVAGDIRNAGRLIAGDTTLVLDGGDQLLEGNVTARGVVMRGGVKRLRGAFATSGRDPAKPGESALVVAEDATLVVEADARWTTPNAYGFQIAGDLIIEGGVFRCSFANGSGREGAAGEDSWLPGSTLTIHSGKFWGTGDADFRGATVTIYDGSLEIDDDLWHTGDVLNVYGGLVRNTKSGGTFGILGTLNMHAGELRAHQSAHRGLQFGAASAIHCAGGLVSLRGRAATDTRTGGILLGRDVTLADFAVHVPTRIRPDSPEAVYLAVTGTLTIAKDVRFDVRGRRVLSSFAASDETGELIE